MGLTSRTHCGIATLALALALQRASGMTPTLPSPIVIAPAANDLPEPPAHERARLRTRERRLRGPIWSAPAPALETA